MANFVINEWLWSDLAGSNGLEAQREGFSAIEWLATSGHQIVIIEGSPFDQKAWRLCKNDDPIVQSMAGIYVRAIRQNSDRCRILKPEDTTPVPAELASVTKPDDHYLLQAQLSVAGAVLVTTDNPLREAVLKAGLRCLSREEFLGTSF